VRTRGCILATPLAKKPIPGKTISLALSVLALILTRVSSSLAHAQVRAYVTNIGSPLGTQALLGVSVIDTSSNTVVAMVGVGDSPEGVAITPDGTRAYVTDTGGVSVSVVDIVVTDSGYNTVVAKVGVGSAPWGVAITPDGTRAYVTNEQSKSVSVIDTLETDSAYNTVVATVKVGVNPIGVAVANIPQTASPAITSGGIVPGTVQPGEWISIYGGNLASATAVWMGDFPTALGGTSVCRM
jgi:YVTN family beta-propeller protein